MSKELNPDNFIFNSRLSFVPLLTSLKKTIAEGKPGFQNLYGELIEKFEDIPELLKQIEDLTAKTVIPANKGMEIDFLKSPF